MQQRWYSVDGLYADKAGQHKDEKLDDGCGHARNP
jgi:hypothetical protein